jgi:phosphonate utilization associated putative membrane protein
LDNTVLALLATSVAMHVTWNLLARAAPSDCNFLWWGISGHLLLLGPWSLFALAQNAHWSWRLAGLMSLTSVALAGYFLALAKAYRLAPVAVVYPISRGLPVLAIAVLSVVLTGERLSSVGWAGMLVGVTGLVLIASAGRRGQAGPALPWVLLASAGTTVYSLSDKAAVVALPGMMAPIGYVSAVYIVALLGLTGLNLQRHGRLSPPRRPPLLAWLTASLCIGSSYALVIAAMRHIPAAYAVAFTNAGISIAVILSMTLQRERRHWQLNAAGVVVAIAGLILVAFA